jgi:hypothetical protein
MPKAIPSRGRETFVILEIASFQDCRFAACAIAKNARNDIWLWIHILQPIFLCEIAHAEYFPCFL